MLSNSNIDVIDDISDDNLETPLDNNTNEINIVDIFNDIICDESGDEESNLNEFYFQDILSILSFQYDHHLNDVGNNVEYDSEYEKDLKLLLDLNIHINVHIHRMLVDIGNKYNVKIEYNYHNSRKFEKIEKLFYLYKKNRNNTDLYNHINYDDYLVIHFNMLLMYCNDLKYIYLSDNFIYIEILNEDAFYKTLDHFTVNYKLKHSECDVAIKSDLLLRNFTYQIYNKKNLNVYNTSNNQIYVNNMIIIEYVIYKSFNTSSLVDIRECYFIHYYYLDFILDKYLNIYLSKLLSNDNFLKMQKILNVYMSYIINYNSQIIYNYHLYYIKIILVILFTVNLTIVIKLRNMNIGKYIYNMNIIIFIMNIINMYDVYMCCHINTNPTHIKEIEKYNYDTVVKLYTLHIMRINKDTIDLLSNNIDYLFDTSSNRIVHHIIIKLFNYNNFHNNSINYNIIYYLSSIILDITFYHEDKIKIYELINIINEYQFNLAHKKNMFSFYIGDKMYQI